MAKPQQPEVHRSGKGAPDPQSAKAAAEVATEAPAGGRVSGALPADNQPGHHSEREQDKPEGPPRRRSGRAARTADAAELIRPIEITAKGFTFRGLAAGPDDGELVLLLHGFPQTSSAWRPQLTALGASGFRAVAVDQRGYSPGARPHGTSAYRLEHLVDDVLAIAGELGAPQLHLVGHDWGGIVGWAFAAAHGDRLHTFTSVSTPHPRAYASVLPRSLQSLRSLYIAFFVLPRVPELVLGAGGGRGLRRMLERSGLPADAAAEYARAMAEPGALTAALNWYRALRPVGASSIGPVDVPTLYVWSDGDVALGRAAAEATAAQVNGPYRFEVLHGVSHWVPETRPDEITRLVVDHVQHATARA